MSRLAIPAGIVATVGLVATGLIAVLVVDAGTSIGSLAGLSAAVAAAAGIVGTVVAWLLRRRSLGVQVTLVALTAIAAVALGAWAAARTMLVAKSDLASLAVILTASATGAATTAMIVTQRLRHESQTLVRLTRAIAGLDDTVEPDLTQATLPATAELQTVGRALLDAMERLRTARDRERSAEEARRELVAWMSHDLRTPLASVRAMVSALEDRVVQDPASVDRYHRKMREEVDHLAQLIDDLFELNRAHAQPASSPRDTVTLSDLASDAMATMRPLAEEAGIVLSGHATQDVTVTVAVRDVARALRNVIDNAVRNTPSGGTVAVTTMVRDGMATVDVRDACGGIPAAVLPRVFDVGFTGQASRTRETEDGRPRSTGGGLGLAVAKGMVELHAGRVSVENVPGGCCFSVQLPPTPAAVRAEVTT